MLKIDEQFFPSFPYEADLRHFPTMSLEELQRWWEIPAIAHFCCLFAEAFNLNDFDIEELEAALLAEVRSGPLGMISSYLYVNDVS